MNDKNKLDTVAIARIRDILDAAERHDPNCTEVTFEYIIAGAFPLIWNNILDKLKQEHTAGYIEGIADSNNLTIDEIYDKIKEKREEDIVNIVSKMQEKVIND